MNGFLLLVSISLLQPKEEKVYQRLEKSYSKSTEKCFELANKYQHRDKTLASPYYFQVLCYEKKAEQARKTADQALALGNAAGNGVHFEKYADEALLSRTEWEDKKLELREKIIDCLVKLKQEHNTDRRKRLQEKAEKLFGNIKIPSESSNPTVVETVKKTEATTIADNQSTNTVNLAKPTGKERIKAYDASSEQELLKLINQERAIKKLAPLKLDSNLVWAARYHASDMAHDNYFDHDSYNRVNGQLVRSQETFERIRVFYSQFANTENIAAGNSTAEATYDQWFNSPGHYANMFNASAKSVGIGMAYDPSSSFGYYWVFCTGY